MSLEKLINQIKQDADRELGSLKKDHLSELEKIDKERQEKIDRLEKEQEKELIEEKKKILSGYGKDREFRMNMDILRLEKELIERAVSAAKEKAKDISSSQKKEILRKTLDRFESRLVGEYSVFVPVGEKSYLENVFENISGIKLQEKELNFKNGFIIEGDKFVFKVDLDGLIDGIAEEGKDFFARLLFKR